MKKNMTFRNLCQILMQRQLWSKISIRTNAQKSTKKQILINLNVETIEYFKDMANRQGVPYQSLMNIFLNQCAQKKLEIKI